MEETEAMDYLKSLLNKTLRVHATDGRMFIGEFKCTDNESNVILANTYEYRAPSIETVRAQVQAAEASGTPARVAADMSSRFLGLIVVPGQHITKIEVEEEEAKEDNGEG